MRVKLIPTMTLSPQNKNFNDSTDRTHDHDPLFPRIEGIPYNDDPIWILPNRQEASDSESDSTLVNDDAGEREREVDLPSTPIVSRNFFPHYCSTPLNTTSFSEETNNDDTIISVDNNLLPDTIPQESDKFERCKLTLIFF